MHNIFLKYRQHICNYTIIFCKIPINIKSLDLFRFLGSDDPDSFFTRAQRSRMVYEILATAAFGKEKKGEVGIERLVEEGAYNAAFPLHDVSI